MRSSPPAGMMLLLLLVSLSHLVSGMSFMTPEGEATNSPGSSSSPADLLHSSPHIPGAGHTPESTPISPGVLTTALTSSPPAAAEEETTTTLITTTTITTMHAPVQCNATLSGMEDSVESPDPASSSASSATSSMSPLECTYSITVYSGYGVEIQVRKVNLSKEESLTILGYGGVGPELLANETLMREGQVIRSTTNQVYIHYRSLRQTNHGMFSLHYQAFLLYCQFPASPEGGGVTVTDIHPGGLAHFHCDPGFQVRGHETATCVNATQPHWSTPEPQCVAVSCGGWVHNATVGRILSPPPPSVSNHSNGNNLSCHWLIEAKEGHKLHLHFERVALDEDEDKLLVRNGNSSLSPVLFDSDLDDVPERGLVSEGSTLYLELTTDSSSIPLLLALRYEGEPPSPLASSSTSSSHHLRLPWPSPPPPTTLSSPHNLLLLLSSPPPPPPPPPTTSYSSSTTSFLYISISCISLPSSDITFQLGTVVTFACSPGFLMEQGSGSIECVDPSDPRWNETEPVCRAVCGGDLMEPSGTVLSPDWPQSYSKGQDCVWQIHVNEEKRIELDVQILNIRNNDVLTLFDGRDLMSHVIGQYMGSRERFQVVSGGSEITIQFQSDADDSSFILSQGFLIHYREVEPNDTCPTLPQIEFGWISSSHSSPVRGSVLTYQCRPGYDISGSDIITCQWDLSWSNSPPTCVKVQQCPDPGEVVNGARSVRPEAGFAVGTVVRFSCNQGYQLEGPSQISCHARDTGTPKWSDRSPKCVLKYDPCPNPGVPDNGYQTLYKHSYQAGETLRFFCYENYELVGEVIIHFSQSFEPSHRILSENIALAIVLPIILVILLIGGIYMYYTNPITVESDFNNPLYEAGVSL
ncbi:hypothetical protein CRUP_001987 [Coryphaenoides rupestris]|nr:hypothetical protein CRUP_001987 [Coryphaenoides rupestris]